MTKEKIKLTPQVCFYHDEKDENLIIEAELPGVSKESLDVDIGATGLCISGKREDVLYSGCYILGHEIVPDKSEAKYENGLLRIKAPFKEAEEKVKVEVK